MNKTGLSRPGGMQMVLSAILMIVVAIGPMYIAASRPDHEWSVVLNGLPALAVTVASVVLLLLYFIGFLRYCASKGYSKWLGLWLFLGHVFGLIVLLLLPDQKTAMQKQHQT